MNMPPLSAFKEMDVRQMLRDGFEPLPEILSCVESLPAGAGLLVVAPFMPSPLIERLRGSGFTSKLEPGLGGVWRVYFWRDPS
jgi:uncharacterized protein (DUF2249 family)